MKPRPLIVITCSSAQDSADGHNQDRLNVAYSEAVARAGGCPIIAPTLDVTDLLIHADGLLLSGGLDVSPEHYGDEAAHPSVQVDARRDKPELALIREAIRLRKPILAICRGIQSLNVALGGTLVQDIPTQRPSAIRHRQTERRHVATHSIRIAEDSLLAHIVQSTSLDVNSFHHQAVDRVAAGLRPTAWAEDGIIEAVEGIEAGRFLLAVQYHPEEMTCAHAVMLFSAFIDAAARTSTQTFNGFGP